MDLAGLVLAAGAGRRYGMPKALLAYRGDLLVRRAAGTLRAAGCTPTLVVVGAEAARVRAAAPELDYVDNPDWPSGMGSSLRAGLAVLAGGPATAVVVLLVDMPGVTPEAVRRIASRATPTAPPTDGMAPDVLAPDVLAPDVLAPDVLALGGYGDRRGHPVLLGRAHWAGVAAAATGDRGARDYLRSHADSVLVVPVGDVADDTDLDVPVA